VVLSSNDLDLLAGGGKLCRVISCERPYDLSMLQPTSGRKVMTAVKARSLVALFPRRDDETAAGPYF
jgi:hypothetical protein